MKIIEVKSDKLEKMSCMVEEMLSIGGKLMSCIDSLEHSEMYGERNSMRGGRYAEPEDDDYPRKRRRDY